MPDFTEEERIAIHKAIDELSPTARGAIVLSLTAEEKAKLERIALLRKRSPMQCIRDWIESANDDPKCWLSKVVKP